MLDKELLDFLKKYHMDHFGQDQRALADQLVDLYQIATFLKMYDAADFLFAHVNKKTYKENQCLEMYNYKLKKGKKNG